jgi:hypothetical protein
MNDDLKKLSEQAVDLDKVREQAEERVEAERREQAERAVAAAQAWDRSMRRVFKGIMPRKTAHRFLMEAARRDDA